MPKAQYTVGLELSLANELEDYVQETDATYAELFRAGLRRELQQRQQE